MLLPFKKSDKNVWASQAKPNFVLCSKVHKLKFMCKITIDNVSMWSSCSDTFSDMFKCMEGLCDVRDR